MTCCPQVPPPPRKQPSGYDCLPRGKDRNVPNCKCFGTRNVCVNSKPKVYTCSNRRFNTNCICCADF